MLTPTIYLYSHDYNSVDELNNLVMRYKELYYAEIERTVDATGNIRVKLRRIPGAPHKCAKRKCAEGKE